MRFIIIALTLTLLLSSFAYADTLISVDTSCSVSGFRLNVGSRIVGESFNISSDVNIYAVAVQLKAFGTPPSTNVDFTLWNQSSFTSNPVFNQWLGGVNQTTISGAGEFVNLTGLDIDLPAGRYFLGANATESDSSNGLRACTTGSEVYINGSFWDRTSGVWTNQDGSAQYNDGGIIIYGNLPAPPSGSIAFITPTPSDGNRTNNNVTIRWNSSTNRSDFYLGTTNPPTSKYLSNVSNNNETYTFLTNVSDGTYYYYASLPGDNSINTTVYRLVVDTQSPVITLNPNNFVTIENISLYDQYTNDSIRINITTEDNVSLYQLSINITSPNGTSYFDYLNTTLNTTTSFNYSSIIDTSGWANNTLYTGTIISADPHTAKSIRDYNYTYNATTVTFDTAEGNTIIIRSLRSADWNITKNGDRYSFGFAPYSTDAQNKYKFQVWCSEGFDYLKNTGYDGHLACMNWATKAGNWLDFEGTGNQVDVTDEGEGWYEIEVEFEGDQVEFNSIGGLNVNTVSFEWYKGDYKLVAPSGFDNANSTLMLNLSIGGKINDANVTFTYNNTLQSGVTKTTFANYIIFNKTITSPAVDNLTNIPYVWNVTYSQGSNLTNFAINANHTVVSFDIDDCTTYTFLALNYSFIDERSGSYVTASATGSYNFTLDGSSYKQYALSITNKQSFGICMSVDTDNLTTDYSLSYSNVDYPERDYEQTNVLLGTPEQNVTLYMVNSTFGLYARFKTVDQFSNALKDVYAEVTDNGDVYQSAYTDDAGLVTFWVDPDETYTFTFTKTGYTTQTLNINPTSSDIYTVEMPGDQGQTSAESAFIGMTYNFYPISSVLNNGTNTTFLFNLSSTYYTLQNCTLALYDVNGSLLTSNNAQASAGVCKPTFYFNTSTYTTLTAKGTYFFNQTRNFTVVYGYSVLNAYIGNRSLYQAFLSMADYDSWGFNDKTKKLIAFLVIFGLSALITISRVNLAVIDPEEAGLISGFFMTIFFSYLNWIPLTLPFDVPYYFITQYGISLLIGMFVIITITIKRGY